MIKINYGISRQSQAAEMVKDVVQVLGGGRLAELLLIETAQQETHLGLYRDPTKDGAGRGITQFDWIGVEDVIARTPQRLKDAVYESFGINLDQLEHDDLDYQPLTCFILTRLKYRLIPSAIPDTLEGRANYWKQYYNTAAGKGQPEEYIQHAGDLVFRNLLKQYNIQ